MDTETTFVFITVYFWAVDFVVFVVLYVTFFCLKKSYLKWICISGKTPTPCDFFLGMLGFVKKNSSQGMWCYLLTRSHNHIPSYTHKQEANGWNPTQELDFSQKHKLFYLKSRSCIYLYIYKCIYFSCSCKFMGFVTCSFFWNHETVFMCHAYWNDLSSFSELKRRCWFCSTKLLD